MKLLAKSEDSEIKENAEKILSKVEDSFSKEGILGF